MLSDLLSTAAKVAAAIDLPAAGRALARVADAIWSGQMSRQSLALLVLLGVGPYSAGGGGGNPAPTDIALSSSSIADNASANTVVGELSVTDPGESSWSFAITNGNTKFELSASSGATVNLERSATGTLTAGVNESVEITVTDAASNQRVETFTITVTAGGQSQVTTLTARNNTGSTISSGWPSKFYDLEFPDSDTTGIAAGAWPEIRLNDGTTVVSTTFINPVYWPSGRMRSVLCRSWVPASISASSTITLKVFNGASAPANSGLGTGNLPNVDTVLTGLTNLSGTWTADLPTGTATLIANGAAGPVYMVKSNFDNAGAHGQLVQYALVALCANASDGLAGTMFRGRVAQPYLDIDTPTKDTRHYTAVLNGPSGQIRNCSRAAKTASYSGTANRLTVTGHDFETCTAFRSSADIGSASAGTNLYARVIDANTIEVYTDPRGAHNNGYGGQVTFTSFAGGTLTPHIAHPHFASWFTCGDDGEFDFIAGTSASQPDADILQDLSGFLKGQTVPAVDTSITADADSDVYVYRPMGSGPVTRFLGAAGGRPDIGQWTGWAMRCLLNRSKNHRRQVRVAALAQASMSIGLRRAATDKVPVVNNTAYTGMGSAAPTMRWTGTAASGFTAPSTTGGPTMGGWTDNYGTDHWPTLSYPAYKLLGEPDLLWLVQEAANNAVVARDIATRNITVGATTYYGAQSMDNFQTRTDAWGKRCVAEGAGATPAGVERDYFTDLVKADVDAINAWDVDQGGIWLDGFYHFRTQDLSSGHGAPWQFSFLVGATAQQYLYTRYAAALTKLNRLMNFPEALRTTIGVLHLTCFIFTARQANGPSAAYITDINDIHFHPGGDHSSTIEAGSDVLTMSGMSSLQIQFTNGDSVKNLSGTVPGGLSLNQKVFLREVSGFTAKVETSPGAGAINITSDGQLSFYRFQNIPSTSWGMTYQGWEQYQGDLYAALNLAASAGADHASDCLTQLAPYIANISGTKAASPKNGGHAASYPA